MNAVVHTINAAGRSFVGFALPMLIQSSVLVLILLLVDTALRRKVRAVFRYWIWMLVLLKLVLPPSLGSPISFGTWFGHALETPSITLQPVPGVQKPQTLLDWSPQAQLGDGAPGHTLDHGLPQSALPRQIEAQSDPPPASLPQKPAIPAPAVTPSVEPAVIVAAPALALEWPGLVLLAWLAVVIALLLLLLQRAWFVKTLVAQAEAAPARLLTVLDECCTRMRLSRRISLKISPNVTSPVVCGLRRPVILIPRALAPKLQPRDLQAVLLHELAHVKRRDLWVNLAQTLLQIVYFYNPMLWIANLAVRRTREQAVDEAVLVAMGDSAREYPDTLLSVAKLAFQQRPALSLRLIGVVESKSALAGRIRHILNRPIPKSARLGLLGLCVIALVAAVFLPMAKARPMTERARQLMALAEQEAHALKHSYVGTEHILIALASDSNAVSAKVLANLDVHTDTLRAETMKRVKAGTALSLAGGLPRTLRAKRVMRGAREEARALNHDYLGTEHILLAVVRERESIAAQVLDGFGLTWQQLHQETLKVVESGDTPATRSRTDIQDKVVATLPNGVIVELLGICEHPTAGRQWWHPDGSPLDEAPYDRPGALAIADEPGKIPFQLALRVQDLPDDWYASVQSPGISFSRADNPPYKAGQRLPDLRWLMIEAEPNRTTCTIRCDVVEPWQTIARSSSTLDPSQQTPPDSVVFTEIREAFEQGVAVTVAAFGQGGNDGRVFSDTERARVIAVRKDGQTQDSSFRRLLFHKAEPRQIVVKTKDGRIAHTVPAKPDSEELAGLATAFFFQLPLADVKEFQFQTRPLTWAEFHNVPLRPGHKTDLQITIGSTADQSAGGGALVDPAQDPMRETTTQDSPRAVAKLPNGVRVEFLAYSQLSAKGLQWWTPHGKPTTISGIHEADVEGLGTIAAFAIDPPEIDLTTVSYRSGNKRTYPDEWRLGKTNIWLVAQGDEGNYANVELTAVRWDAPISHTIPIDASDAEGTVSVNDYGISRISNLRSSQLDSFAIMLAVHYARQESARATAVVDVNGLRHSISGRGRSRTVVNAYTHRSRLPLEQLSGIVFEIRRAHSASVRFMNVSLTPDRQTEVGIDVGDLRQSWQGAPAHEKLTRLNQALQVFAREHNGAYPDTLEQLTGYLTARGELEWAIQNIAYLGQGRKVNESPATPLAYDMELLAQQGSTYVLHNNHLVLLEGPKRLRQLGIPQPSDRSAPPELDSAINDNYPKPGELREGNEAERGVITGRVVDPNGNPATGAQVGLCTTEIGIRMSNGILEEYPAGDTEKGPIVETDARGRFRLETEPVASSRSSSPTRPGTPRLPSQTSPVTARSHSNPGGVSKGNWPKAARPWKIRYG